MRFGQTALFALDPGINPLLMVILGVFLYGLAVPIVLLIQEDDAVPLEFTSTSFVSALKRLRDIAFIREELFRLLRMVCRDRRMWFILSSLGIILLLTPVSPYNCSSQRSHLTLASSCFTSSWPYFADSRLFGPFPR